MTVAELFERMSADEFRDWQEYYQMEPFGPLADDIRFGTIAAMYQNAHRREGSPAVGALDIWQWHMIAQSDQFFMAKFGKNLNEPVK